jgi:hypothetical protein
MNYLSLDERLPTVFMPVSPPPYMNGGPRDYLSWVIESKSKHFMPSACAEWLEGRLPRPVTDSEAVEKYGRRKHRMNQRVTVELTKDELGIINQMIAYERDIVAQSRQREPSRPARGTSSECTPAKTSTNRRWTRKPGAPLKRATHI